MNLFSELDQMLKQDEERQEDQQDRQAQQEQEVQRQAQAREARWEREAAEAAADEADEAAELEAELHYRKRFPQTALNSQAIRHWTGERVYEIYGAPSFHELDAEQRKEFCDWILALPGRKTSKPRKSLWQRIWDWLLDR